jgi:peptidoglycan/LPS O-acetylase OafA/YrhL
MRYLENNITKRFHFIDWLRVIAALMVFCIHVAMIFVSWDWHIKDSHYSFIMDTFVRFIYLWIMTLLFLLSGASTWSSLRYRSERGYIIERFRRLIVPLFLGILTIVPPQVYLERISKSEFNGSFFQFYYYFFDGIYPYGNFTLNHLWFLLYLFVISLITLPVLKLMNNRIDKIVPIQIVSSLKPWILFVPVLPLIIVEGALRHLWPLYLYPADIIIFFTYFVYGYLIISENKIRDSIKRHSNSAFLIGLISFSVITVLYYLNKIPAPGSSWSYILFQACWSVIGWFWIVAIMGFGLKHLNRQHRVLSYANEAVLPFYILHQTIILIVGYYVVQWEISLLMKFLFIITTAFFITCSLYFLIWQSNLARIVFGLKTKSKANTYNASGCQ